MHTACEHDEQHDTTRPNICFEHAETGLILKNLLRNNEEGD